MAGGQQVSPWIESEKSKRRGLVIAGLNRSLGLCKNRKTGQYDDGYAHICTLPGKRSTKLYRPDGTVTLMKPEGASSATRDSLLEAAKRVIQKLGAAHLTLEAVAKEAGVSKGGLLYHFPNKHALLKGMMMKGIRHHVEEMDQAVGPEPARGAFARCFLRHAIFGAEKEDKPPAELIWSMIGAAANDPTLLEPAREMNAYWHRQLDEDLPDHDVAALLRLVGHGLWSAELFGFSVPDPAQRERLLTLLSKLAGLDGDPHPSTTRTRVRRKR